MRSLPFDIAMGGPCTPHDRARWLDRALVSSFCWTDELFACFFATCRNPRRAARAYATRRVRAGEFHAARFDVRPLPQITRPLATSRDPVRPDCGQLSYAALTRSSSPPVSTTVYWPSAAFARTHASWTGSDDLPNPYQISHSLLCTAVWLAQFRLDPERIRHWTSERELQFRARRGDGSGAIPDGLIRQGDEITAIEVLGQYPPDWIQHHVDQFEDPARGWEWELW